MMGLGVPELAIIAVIALFIFGGKRFATLGKDLGMGLRNLKDGLRGVIEDDEPKKPDHRTDD